MNIEQYLGIFIDETRENLQNMDEYLLELEKDINNLEIVNTIFRFIHTVKGMAATMGFENISNLTHNMENILDKIRNNKLKATPNILDTLFCCLDRLTGLLDSVIKNNNDHGDIKDLIDRLNNLENQTCDIPLYQDLGLNTDIKNFNEFEIMVMKEAKSRNNKILEILVTLDNECLLPAARAFMVDRTLEEYGEVLKTIPETEKLESGEFDNTFKLFFITQSEEDFLKSLLLEISEIDNVLIKLIDVEELDSDINDIPTFTDNDVAINTLQQESKTSKNTQANSENTAHSKIPQTVRVSAERLDKLMNLVGELVINRTRLEQIVYEKQYSNIPNSLAHVATVTSDIQEIVMKLRMVPMDNIFNRFPRLVRDLSKDLGKLVNLKINGQDTEMDRAVIGELSDPLVHLIRNSLDHGLETPEERLNAGKTEEGLIELNAYNEGDNIIIKIRDDGRGLNLDKIKNKALEKGIVKHDDLKSMSDQQIRELIFLPGFSTNEVATDVSGRGVGMDVVKTKISTLGGIVSIDSEVNKGTIVTICLPSTIVILQALLVNVGPETYAIPLNNINEIIDIQTNEIFTIQNQEIILLRGKTLPLIRMHSLLDVDYTENLGNETLTVAIVQASDRCAGIVVSGLIGQKEVVIKPINKKLCEEDYFSGATTLGNGDVSLIFNVNSLFKN